tara:strand:- start:61 stop:678 length:618 start_codon:yes stop_codon:yes gene_type:complete
MARTERVTGNLTLDPTGDLLVLADASITGNLTVNGTTTTITTTDTAIKDRQIVLNDGETGAGVTGRYSGLEIERGSASNALLVFDETTDTFVISTDGGSSYGSITQVVDDVTPQLGGDLDVQGFNIVTATSNADIHLVPSGTGRVTVEAPLKLNDQASTPSSAAGSTLLYAGTAAGGGTGIFFVDGGTSDELVSKSKSIVYGLIF